jgi:CBS domain containing-hemolysin-like protein
MIFDIFLTLFLVFLNGFFVAAEFAIVKVRLSQIELRARGGSLLARMAKNIIEHLDAYLSATQLGITLASLGLGWIGESVVASVISIVHLLGVQMEPDTAHKFATPAAFMVITFLHIVLGELAPKSLAIQRSEPVVLAVALPMKAFYLLFKPFIWSLNSVATVLLRMIGIEPAREQELHSAEELRYLFEESSRSGMIETTEQEMIENVFVFQETTAAEIMVPRGRIVGLEITMPSELIVSKVIEEGYSRMPVYQGTLDNIVGVVYAKDLLTMMSFSALIILQDIIRPLYFVQADEKIHRILARMQKQKFHMAIVLDEFGGTAGLITLEDIMEELVGEIQDEYDEETPIVQASSESEWTIGASASIADINRFLPQPLPESEEYQTLSGMINHVAGRIPAEKEILNLPPAYECMILEASARRVEKIRLSIAKPHLVQTTQE